MPYLTIQQASDQGDKYQVTIENEGFRLSKYPNDIHPEEKASPSDARRLALAAFFLAGLDPSWYVGKRIKFLEPDQIDLQNDKFILAEIVE